MGINIPDFSDIQQSVATVLTNTYGSQLNLDPSTPTGQQAYNLAVSFQSQYQILQEAESSASVFSAQGNQLDNLTALLNIKRTDGAKTVCKSCVLTGTNGTIIPAGSEAKTADDIIFYSSYEVTIAGGTAVVDFISEDFGQFDVEVNTLNIIVSTISGWTAITNPTVGVDGADNQTDAELRQDVLTRSQNLARGYSGSIKASVEGVAGVLQAYVYVNYSNSTAPTPFSIPAHGVLVVIQYADQTLNPAIAEAIFTKLPCVTSYSSSAGGTQITQAVTITGGDIDINWNMAEEIPLNFVITIKELTTFTAEDSAAVTTTIQTYLKENATISGIIYYSKIYAAVVDAVPNGFIESFYMSRATTPTSTDIVPVEAAFWEVFVAGTVVIQYGS